MEKKNWQRANENKVYSRPYRLKDEQYQQVLKIAELENRTVPWVVNYCVRAWLMLTGGSLKLNRRKDKK